MSFRRIQDPPADTRSWVAWLLAAGVTLILFLSMGLSAASVRSGGLLRDVVPHPAPDRPEHLVFQTLPQSATSTAEPETPAPSETSARQRTTPSARVPAAPPTQPRIAPDSGSSAGTARPPATSTPRGIAPLDPRLAFPVKPTPPIGADAAVPCTAPCGVGGRAGASLSKRALTRAERDSVLQALSASVPAAAAEAGRGGAGDSSGMRGTSISIPLPGGGPSREQRQHDSTVNAHVLPILERLRRRADSVRAARRRDSLEAIDKRRRDSIEAIAKQRDSTSGGWR